MSFLHRHRWLTPYLLLAPGLAFLALFFVVPLCYLGYQSLQTGSFDVGYTFTWAWENYSDAITTYHEQFIRSLEYAGDRDGPRARRSATRSRTGSRSAAGAGRTCCCSSIIAPFFVTYLIRTLAWQTILADDGFVVEHAARPAPARRRRPAARHLDGGVAGITYNFLPFMALPLYVVAGADRPAADRGGARTSTRAACKAFLRVTLPLSLPGRLRRDAADVHPGGGRLHQRAAARDAAAAHDRQRDPVEVPRADRLPGRRRRCRSS